MNLYLITFRDGRPSQFIEAFDLETVKQFMKTLGYTELDIVIKEF
jgi:hypothetical protein